MGPSHRSAATTTDGAVRTEPDYGARVTEPATWGKITGDVPTLLLPDGTRKTGFVHRKGATRAFGADDPDLVAQVKAATRGGVDIAIEAASSVKALDAAYKITRRGGTTVTCSLPPPSHTFNVPAVNLVAEERTLKGSYLGSAVPARDIPHYIALFQAGRLPVDKLITHRLTLDQINEGFDRLDSGEAVRQVIMF